MKEKKRFKILGVFLSNDSNLFYIGYDNDKDILIYNEIYLDNNLKDNYYKWKENLSLNYFE
jgi:hypothetical protein